MWQSWWGGPLVRAGPPGPALRSRNQDPGIGDRPARGPAADRAGGRITARRARGGPPGPALRSRNQAPGMGDGPARGPAADRAGVRISARRDLAAELPVRRSVLDGNRQILGDQPGAISHKAVSGQCPSARRYDRGRLDATRRLHEPPPLQAPPASSTTSGQVPHRDTAASAGGTSEWTYGISMLHALWMSGGRFDRFRRARARLSTTETGHPATSLFRAAH